MSWEGGGGVTFFFLARLNDIRDIESKNGAGCFKVSFFIDTAFWVPWYDDEHFNRQSSVGTFTKFEPELRFPEVDVEGGMLRWGLRSAYFGSKAHQHETQLGQNYVTPVKGGQVSVVDPGSHWPRMWRVCISDEEIAEMAKLDKPDRKKLEPTNEKPMQVNPRLRKLFTKLDEERRTVHLRHPLEGIAFVTYEIHCTHRNNFELHEFPFDIHCLNIVVRLDRKDGDPMRRLIVPIGHDKAFFVSGRVPPMVDYHLARNLDWAVTKEANEYGGHDRIQAAAIVRRKPGYYIRNYVIIIFLITSSACTAFMAGPDNMEGRTTVIFMVLLAIIAFKYSGSSIMPTVPYATTLDYYITHSFYTVLVIGVICFAFSAVCTSGGSRGRDPARVDLDISCSKEPGRWYGLGWLPAYDPVAETATGLLCTFAWLLFNAHFWWPIWKRVQATLQIVDEVDIGWMSYKATKKPGMPRSKKFYGEVLIRSKADRAAAEAEEKKKAEGKKAAAAADKAKAAAAVAKNATTPMSL